MEIDPIPIPPHPSARKEDGAVIDKHRQASPGLDRHEEMREELAGDRIVVCLLLWYRPSWDDTCRSQYNITLYF